jgi:hypothetical protein
MPVLGLGGLRGPSVDLDRFAVLRLFLSFWTRVATLSGCQGWINRESREYGLYILVTPQEILGSDFDIRLLR